LKKDLALLCSSVITEKSDWCICFLDFIVNFFPTICTFDQPKENSLPIASWYVNLSLIHKNMASFHHACLEYSFSIQECQRFVYNSSMPS
jgi:hypothetical protein